jgi:hypothetical protein
MIIIKLVTEKSELVDICDLNYANRRCNLTDDEAKSQGDTKIRSTIRLRIKISNINNIGYIYVHLY